jgi:hypothetical protein
MKFSLGIQLKDFLLEFLELVVDPPNWILAVTKNI